MKITAQRATARRVSGRRSMLVVALASGVVVAALSAVGVVQASEPPAIVAEIAGEPVGREELLFHMERVRPAIENRVLVETGSPVDDWSAALPDGLSPVQLLRDAAIDEIRSDREIFGLALEHELVSYSGFDGFEEALSAENAKREDAAARGEVVYGSTSFTDQEFYGRTIEDLRTRLLAFLTSPENPQLVVEDDEVVGYLANYAAEWSANEKHYSLTRLAVVGGDSADAIDAAVTAAGFEAFAAQHPAAQISSVDFDGGSQTFGGDAVTPSPGLVAQLATLDVGGVTSAVSDRGTQVVYRVDAVSVDPDAALAEYGDRIRTVLSTEKFDALIDSRTAGQSVTLDTHALESITMEDLNR